MTNRPTQSNNRSDGDLELLSSYLDNQLTVAERMSLERRLRLEPELRAELEELRTTIGLVRDITPVTPPRAFTLDPAQVQPRRPFLSGWIRFGSALAALVLALTVTTMLFVSRQESQSAASVAQMEAAAAPTSDSAAHSATRSDALPGNPEALTKERAEEAPATVFEAPAAEAPAAAAPPRPEATAGPASEPEGGMETAGIQPPNDTMADDTLEGHQAENGTPVIRSPDTVSPNTLESQVPPAEPQPRENGGAALLRLVLIGVVVVALVALSLGLVWRQRSR